MTQTPHCLPWVPHVNLLVHLILNIETLKIENVIFLGQNYKCGIFSSYENMQRNKQKSFFPPPNWNQGLIPVSKLWKWKLIFGRQPRCWSPRTRTPSLTNARARTHTPTVPHPVSVCMRYVLGIASVCLCWSRQSWARPTDHHQEEETEELGQQRQQQRGHRRRQEAQPGHQLQPLQSGTCKHQLHSVCLLLLCHFIIYFFFKYCFLSLHACLQGWTKAGNITSLAPKLFNLKQNN